MCVVVVAVVVCVCECVVCVYVCVCAKIVCRRKKKPLYAR